MALLVGVNLKQQSMEARSGPEVVALTAVSAGLGRAIVQEFARHAAHVGLLSRAKDRREDARRD